MVKKILFILAILVAGITANAQKWYVSATGDDADGDGSETYPWASLDHAADTIYGAAFAGDTIYIQAGSIVEDDSIHISAGVTVTGTGSTSVINFTWVDDTYTNACIILESSSDGTLGNQSISYLQIDGGDVAYYGILVKGRSNVKIDSVTMVDFVANAITMRGRTAAGSGGPTTYATFNEISNCVITNCSQRIYSMDYYDGQLKVSGQDGIEIYDNVLTNLTATHCNNNIDLKSGYNKGIKIYNNKSYKPDYVADEWNFHIESWDGMGGNHVYDNEFNGGGVGVDVAGYFNERGVYEYSWLVENNYFGQTTQTVLPVGGNQDNIGVSIEGDSRDVIVRYNYFQNIASGVSMNAAKYSDPDRYYDIIGMDVYYNIFENIGYTNQNSWVFYLNNGNAGCVFENIRIYNNTIVSNGDYHCDAVLFMTPTGPMENIYFRNNIVEGMTIAPIYIYEKLGQVSNLYNQNNVLYDNGNSNLIKYYLSPTVINYTVSGIVNSDPLFVGSGTPPADFKLQSGSPAKDVGYDVGLTYDYGGYSIPVGPLPDFGAWEYGADIDPPDWSPTGIGWEPILKKVNFKDEINFVEIPTIAGTPLNLITLGLSGLIADVDDLNATVGATDNFQGQINAKAALSDPSFTTSITVAGDTTVTAVVGKVVYQAADSSFYGCRSTVADKKWYKLND